MDSFVKSRFVQLFKYF